MNHHWNTEENGRIKTTTVDSLFSSAFYKMAEQMLRTVEGERVSTGSDSLLKGQRKSLRVSQSWERTAKNSKESTAGRSCSCCSPAGGVKSDSPAEKRWTILSLEQNTGASDLAAGFS